MKYFLGQVKQAPEITIRYVINLLHTLLLEHYFYQKKVSPASALLFTNPFDK